MVVHYADHIGPVLKRTLLRQKNTEITDRNDKNIHLDLGGRKK